jgi:hypothetical protein
VGIAVSHSLRTWCRSEWHTPQWLISICTSRGPGARRWMVSGASLAVAAEAAYALVVRVRAAWG